MNEDENELSSQDLPKKPTLFDIIEIFNSDENCVDFLFKYNILRVQQCPHCNVDCKVEHAEDRHKRMYKDENILYIHQCTSNKRHVFSLSRGSILQNNVKMTYFNFILLVYLYSAKCTSPVIQTLTGFSDKTVNYYLGKVIRPAICTYVKEWYKTFKFEQNTGIATQIDEMLATRRRKYNVGANKPSKDGKWAVVQTHKDRVVAELVDCRCSNTLETCVLKFNARGQIINVDGFASYNGLASLGYTVWSTPHVDTFVSFTNPDANTEKVEGLNGELRRWLSRYKGFKDCEQLLDECIQEWVFFYNFKNHDLGIFTLIWGALSRM